MKKQIQLLILFLITVQSVLAQQKPLPKIVIPFSLIDYKSIIIQVTIKGKPLLFYFDTGASASLLDKNVAKELGINSNYETTITGAGGQLKYKMALNQKIKLQDIEMDNISLVLDDLTRLGLRAGFKFDGIIGTDILKKYITAVDFDKKTLSLYPFETTLNLSDYLENSFESHMGIPVLNASIQLKNGKKYSGKVLFDSGAALTLLVNSPFKDKNNLIGQSDKVFTAPRHNLSNKTTSQFIAIDKLTFAGHTFSKLPISLSSDKNGVSSYPTYLGILGNQIINRFNFILNYQTKKLYLKKNSLYNMDFNFPVSGVSLSENENGEIYFADVSEKSEFYKNGVRENDILLSVDGVSKGTIFQFRDLIKRENIEMLIEVKQKSGIKKFKVNLKRLI